MTDGGSVGAHGYLLCALGAETVAVSLDSVGGVVRAAWPTRLPGSPEWILGVLNVRGTLHIVCDLSARVLGVAKGLRASDFLVLTEKPPYLALVVHRVVSVSRGGAVSAAGRGDAPTPDETFGASDLLSGVISLGPQLALVLDLDALRVDPAVLMCGRGGIFQGAYS